MKKLLSLSLIFLMSFILIGCQDKKNVEYYDNQYLEALGKGLDRRSSHYDTAEYQNGSDAKQEEITSNAIKEEINSLKPYLDKKFQNPELKKLSEDYYNQLVVQDQNCPYGNDSQKYNKFMEAYDKRSQIITKMIDKFGLKFNSDLMSEFSANSKKVNSQEELNSKILELFKKAEFKRDDTGRYYAQIKNTTGQDLGLFEVDMKAINDGVTVQESQFYNSVEWKQNEEKIVEFYIDSDKSFNKVEFFIKNL